jgi:hypothetical protein
MRWYAVWSVAVAVAVAACSSNQGGAPPPADTSSAVASAPQQSPTSTAALAPDAVAVSPGGVTTKVGAPAESTEDDYFQACRAARTWMTQQGGDPKAQIEPYLKTLQSAPTVGPGDFATSWAQLSPGQQSAVIVAVEAAASALCG